MPLGEVFAIAQEYIDAGRLDAAERMLGHVLAGHPRHADSLHALGLIATRRGRTDEAVALMERGIAAGGASALHWRNIAEAYRLTGRLDAALAAARRAIAFDPADPLGPFTAAMVLYDRQELPACIAAARHCLDLRPDLPQGHMKMAQALLQSGEMARGWEHYEWRYRIPGAAALMPPTDRPQWDGRALPGARLLLIADQGYGDVLMFARYVPWARSRADTLVIACSPEMRTLMGRMFPDIANTSAWDDLPPYACFCPFSGLPRLHGTTLDTIPRPGPTFAPDPARVAHWRGRLDRDLEPGLLRIGIAWAGRPTHSNDRNRSVPLATLAPLGAVPGVALVSLQKGQAAAEAAGWRGPAPLVDLDAEIGDFDDTAAIVGGLDLVVCVDTSVAHLAGLLGRPAWVLLPFAPDWRWLTERRDTPWYPTLRLFRAPAPRRLDAAIGAAAAALAERQGLVAPARG